MKYYKMTCEVFNKDDEYEVVNGYEVGGQEYENEFLDWRGTPSPRLFVYKCNSYKWAVADMGSGAVIPLMSKMSSTGYNIREACKNTRDDRLANAIEHLQYVGADRYIDAINRWEQQYPKGVE